MQFELDLLDGISEEFKKEYKKCDNGKFRLDVSGLEDVSGLKSALQKEREARKEESRKASAAIEELEKLKVEEVRGKGDPNVIKIYEDKIAELKTGAAKRESDLLGQIGQITAGETATRLASLLARSVKGADGKDYTTADVLEPILRQRLKSDFREGKPVVVVLDKAGNPTANTVEELKNEIINNPSYSPLITGSKASGAGNHGAGPGGGGVDNDIMKLPPVQRMNAARAAAKKSN